MGDIADHVRRHGDGVRDIALWVDDARDAYAKAIERGAESAYEPRVLRDDDGEVVVAGIKIYGDTIHSLVERKNYRGVFMPGFQKRDTALSGAADRPALRRPLRRQRRAREDERLGRVLRARHGLQESRSRSTTRTSRPSIRR